MTFQEKVLEVQKQQLNIFQESLKRHMEFMEKMLTEQKKSNKAEKEETHTFFSSQEKYFVKNELKDLFCYNFLVLQMAVRKGNISKDLLYF